MESNTSLRDTVKDAVFIWYLEDKRLISSIQSVVHDNLKDLRVSPADWRPTLPIGRKITDLSLGGRLDGMHYSMHTWTSMHWYQIFHMPRLRRLDVRNMDHWTNFIHSLDAAILERGRANL
jgi:hypothetical protein